MLRLWWHRHRTLLAILVVAALPVIAILIGWTLLATWTRSPVLLLAIAVGLMAGFTFSITTAVLMQMHQRIATLDARMLDQQIQIDTLRGLIPHEVLPQVRHLFEPTEVG